MLRRRYLGYFVRTRVAELLQKSMRRYTAISTVLCQSLRTRGN
jgi:hypothetical protein